MSYRGAGTLTGPLHLNAHASPGLSTAGEGRIYFDSGTNQFLVSENGGAYASLTNPSSAGGWTDDGTVVRLTTATDRVGIGTSTPTAGYKLEVLGDVTNPAIHLQSGGGGDGIQMESGTGEEIRVVADQNLVLFSGAVAFLGTNAGTSEVRIVDESGERTRRNTMLFHAREEELIVYATDRIVADEVLLVSALRDEFELGDRITLPWFDDNDVDVRVVRRA